MSREILEQLRERTAFKPAPPEYEMAAAHVLAADVGLDGSLDQRVYDAMCSDDEAFVVVDTETITSGLLVRSITHELAAPRPATESKGS